MRVALVDPASYTPPYDHNLAAGLARRGHLVDLFAARFPFGQLPAPDGYRRHEIFLPISGRIFRRFPRSRLRLLVKGLEYVPSVRSFLRGLERARPDVVHVQWLPAPRYDVRWLERLAGERTTVVTAHDVLRVRAPDTLPVWRKIFATVDGIVVHSRTGSERLAELGVAPERIARIPHALFEPSGNGRLERPSGRTLLFFGLIRRYKGVDVLLRAFAEIRRELPGTRLIVAGDPVEPVQPLRDLAASLGLGPDVEWRLGFLADRDVTELMETATVVVLPYRKGDASGVLATALGHGRPAVVSDVGALAETVREFGAGLVVPPEDVPALASACSQLLRDERALAEAYEGTEAARAALTWDNAAEAHEALYDGLLARGRFVSAAV